MTALDIVLGIVAIIAVIVVVIIVIVVVAIREHRADRLANSEIALEEKMTNNLGNGQTGQQQNNGNNAAPSCKKACGCQCAVVCVHERSRGSSSGSSGSSGSRSGSSSSSESSDSTFTFGSSGSSGSSDSRFSTRSYSSGSSDSHSPCERPCPPQLNCGQYINGNFVMSCGDILADGPTGQFFIQWFPECDVEDPLTKYTLYAKRGTNTVSPSNYDFIYQIAPNKHSFMTPNMGTGCWSFVLTASNRCGDSAPSEIFNSQSCQA